MDIEDIPEAIAGIVFAILLASIPIGIVVVIVHFISKYW